MVAIDSVNLPRELASITATEAKNALGAVLDRVLVEGGLAITKHSETRAVLLSVRAFEALLAAQRDPLAELAAEFDGLVEGMQSPRARKAGRALFDAPAAELGRAALATRRGS